MPSFKVHIDDGDLFGDSPYVNLVDDTEDTGQNQRPNKIPTWKKAIGAGIILLLLIIAAVVAVSRGGDVPSTTTTRLPSTTTTTVKTTMRTTTLPTTTTTTITMRTTPVTTSTISTTVKTSTAPTTTRTTTVATTTTRKTTLPPTTTTTQVPSTTAVTTTEESTTAEEHADAPIAVSCGEGGTTMFLLLHNITIGRFVAEVGNVSHAGECTSICAHREDCDKVHFENSTCTVLKNLKQGILEDGMIHHPGFYEKLCIKSQIDVEQTCNYYHHYEAINQRVLIGMGRESVPADNVETCLTHCLHARQDYGFTCQSAMFYDYEKECMLNDASRFTNPNLFIKETDNSVVYLDNFCYGGEEDQEADYYQEDEHPVQILTLPSNNVSDICPTKYEIHHGMVMVGFNEYSVTNITSDVDCLHQCVDPHEDAGGFVCKSVNYYPDFKECMLNSEDRISQPELYVADEEYKGIYLAVTGTTDCREEHKGNATVAFVPEPTMAEHKGM